MKFVFVSYNYDPNFDTPENWFGRVKGYIGILECLSNKHSVTRIKQINYECERLYNGVQYLFVNYGAKRLHFPWKLHRMIRNLDPDVVVIHGLHNPLQAIQLRLQLNNRTKLIAQNHAEKPALGLRKHLQKMADRYIDAYMFASHDMGTDWVNKGNLATAGKIHEVMEVSSVFYPVSKETALVKTGITGAPIFLWVGRLNQNKDPLNVIRAFLQFAKLSASARLYIIYHTEEQLPEIAELLNKEPMHRDSIVLVGRVPHNELLYWFNSADFIISGSHYEGSGTAVCEAMSCGCIPVVTNIFSFRMMTDNGKLGILYEPGDQTALLAALLQTRKMDIDEEREKSLAFFKTNLSFDAIASRMEQIAESIVSSK